MSTNEPDFFNELVIKENGLPAGWRWHSLNAIDMPEDFVKVTGSVPVGKVTKGARKGMPKWDTKASKSFYVRMSEVSAARKQWRESQGAA